MAVWLPEWLLVPHKSSPHYVPPKYAPPRAYTHTGAPFALIAQDMLQYNPKSNLFYSSMWSPLPMARHMFFLFSPLMR